MQRAHIPATKSVEPFDLLRGIKVNLKKGAFITPGWVTKWTVTTKNYFLGKLQLSVICLGAHKQVIGSSAHNLTCVTY